MKAEPSLYLYLSDNMGGFNFTVLALGCGTISFMFFSHICSEIYR
jgi:hypothetical protein